MKHSLKLLVVITILLLNANSCSIDNELLITRYGESYN